MTYTKINILGAAALSDAAKETSAIECKTTRPFNLTAICEMAMSASSATNEGIRVPIFSYFLIIGSVLTGLLFYANSVMVPSPPPFRVSQKIGLPEPYKAPAVVAEAPKPAIFSITAEPTVKVKKSEAAGKHKQMRVVRQEVRQGRYAAYPPREYGSVR